MRKIHLKDLDTIVQEIKRERDKASRFKREILELEKNLVNPAPEIIAEEANALELQETPNDRQWKLRYEAQVEINQQLEAQVSALQTRLDEKRRELKEVVAGGGQRTYTQSELKKLLIALQRQKKNLESQMRDYEWRMDRESENFHKVNEKKKTVFFDIKRQQCKLAEAEAQGRRGSASHPSPGTSPAPTASTPHSGGRQGTLVRGSYVRKLLDRKASRDKQAPSLAIGAASGGGAGSQGAISSPPARPAAPARKLPQITKTARQVAPRREKPDFNLKAHGAEINKRD